MELCQIVETQKKKMGKPLSKNSRQAPNEVKAIGNKIDVRDTTAGFEGQCANGLKSGRARQYWTDGSFFDGFMLESNLCKGRFYFTNGDFFQGSFENNQP